MVIAWGVLQFCFALWMFLRLKQAGIVAFSGRQSQIANKKSKIEMARPNNITLCSFCGKSHAEVKKLIAGPGVYICDNCIILCKSVLDKELSAQPGSSKPKLNIPKPAEIKAQLDRHCIGQEHAKKTLAVAVHNHYKRILQDPRARADRSRVNRRRGPPCGSGNREEQHPDARAHGFGQDVAGAFAGAKFWTCRLPSPTPPR